MLDAQEKMHSGVYLQQESKGRDILAGTAS
jgi:hypothetical protein